MVEFTHFYICTLMNKQIKFKNIVYQCVLQQINNSIEITFWYNNKIPIKTLKNLNKKRINIILKILTL
jgi:hypothetical protein